MKSQILFEYIRETEKTRFNQGDILKDLSIIYQSDFDELTGEAIISSTKLDYAIIITQDCDLEHDYNNRNSNSEIKDKILPNIFVVPGYLENDFRSGKHRGELFKALEWNSSLFKNIKDNNNQRFHFLKENEALQLPNLIVDFKHSFTINTDFIYKYINTQYFVSICEIYRDNLSNRYCHFLNRIGLPDLHQL